MDLNLLQKTELWITDIELCKANLNEIAAAVARVLELPVDAVIVIDVRGNTLALDILRRKVKAAQIVGKAKEMLDALAGLSGVVVTPRTAVHAQGILGLIASDPARREELLEDTALLTEQIRTAVAKRGIIFASGREVQEGLIEDTNSPYLKGFFEQHGFKMSFGEILPDDLHVITGRLRSAAANGFGLVITTGGVGAEDKDFLVESVCKLDLQAETPYILHFHEGHGRHVKNGVRIAVGQVGLTTLVALPGPHDEVRLAAPVLLDKIETDKKMLADALASVLREKWKKAMGHHEFHH